MQQTLEAMKSAIAGGGGSAADRYEKAYTVALGLVNYDLEAGAKLLFPWGQSITPLRNMIARRTSGRGDTAHRWKQITGINVKNMPVGVSEGNRSGVVQTVESDRLSAYAGFGSEDFVTFEAEYAAEGFDDVLALASENLLKSMMISEEQIILNCNSSNLLGTTPTPTGAGSATNGALSDGTYTVVCVALTADGLSRATVAGGVQQTITRINADGSSDTINGGTAQLSAQSSGVVLNAGTAVQRVTAHVTAVQGAVAYAWYLGTSTSHQYLQQITTLNSVNFNTTLVTTTQDATTLAVADYSAVGAYGFDGLLYGAPFKTGLGAYYSALATGTDGVGSQLTTDNAGGIAEINTMLKDRWDNYRLSPDTIWLNSQEMISLKVLIVKNGGAPLLKLNANAESPILDLVAGSRIGSYVNPVTQDVLAIRVHPFQTAGTMLFTTKNAPYAGSRVTTLVEMLCRKEYYSTLWPIRTRKREYGVYVDETLLNYFPPAFAAITNIAPTTN
jgi:hypothetical protein